ncbi:outer membrane beta-barrel protein [Cryomorphaceae bacterium]|nr:outer membrane beta-barrel protein [Cryomorphaceae bacterium]
MKRTLLVLLMATFGFATQAQNAIELQPYVGFQFGNTIHAYDGVVKTQDGLDWGGSLSIEVRPGVYLELMYSRMETDMRIDEYYGPSTPLFDIDIQYFQIGGLVEQSIGQVAPFGTFTLGAVDYDPQDSRFVNETQFAITFGGGIKYFVSDNIGIRLQARAMMPLYFGGFGFFCGTGGCGGSAYTTSYTFAADLTGGLIFRLGGDSRVY